MSIRDTVKLCFRVSPFLVYLEVTIWSFRSSAHLHLSWITQILCIFRHC